MRALSSVCHAHLESFWQAIGRRAKSVLNVLPEPISNMRGKPNVCFVTMTITASNAGQRVALLAEQRLSQPAQAQPPEVIAIAPTGCASTKLNKSASASFAISIQWPTATSPTPLWIRQTEGGGRPPQIDKQTLYNSMYSCIDMSSSVGTNSQQHQLI